MLEMKDLCVLLLMGAVLFRPSRWPRRPAKATGRSRLLSDAECWKRMPPAESGGGQPLPNWAKAVAVRLPRTAAAMLELDLAQRTKSPLDPVLRAKMRWVIARANRCAYSEAYALADLERASGDAAAVEVADRRPRRAGPRPTATRSSSPSS